MSNQINVYADETRLELLVDGYIARSFSPNKEVEVYLSHLLKMTDYRRLCQTLPNPSGSGVIFVVQIVPHPLQPLRLDPNGHPLWLLDYSITHTGTVVPQVLWSPQNVNDKKQYVVLADLQMPIFFTLQTGNLGISLDDAANNRCQNLCDFRSQAQLGGKTTTYVRIGWPGYNEFKRQIQIKDETENRNPITIGKFAQHLGRSVDAFLQNPSAIRAENREQEAFNERWKGWA